MLRFGSGGLTGSASSLNGQALSAYCGVFFSTVGHNGTVLLSHDYRDQSGEMATLLAGAARSHGVQPVWCGHVSSPALAMAAARRRAPAIFVSSPCATDASVSFRFYTPQGEITRYDEARIAAAVRLAAGDPVDAVDLGVQDGQPLTEYIVRHTAFQSGWPLRGRRIGVIRNGSTGAPALEKILMLLGAHVTTDGERETTIRVDLEDVDSLTLSRLRKWQKDDNLDAIISTDDAGEHPFFMDDTGAIVPGDVLAPICAAELGARHVIVAGTASGVVERMQCFEKVKRLENNHKDIQEAVQKANARGGQAVVGYDTRGGLILGFDSMRGKQTLARLLCRDGILPIVAFLVRVAKSDQRASELLAALAVPHRSTRRVPDLPWPMAARYLRALMADPDVLQDGELGPMVRSEDAAGVRLVFASGETLHFEPSATTAELLIHAEANSRGRAAHLVETAFDGLFQPERNGSRSV